MKMKNKVFWIIATIVIVLGAAASETTEVETKQEVVAQTTKPTAREVYDYYQALMEQYPSPELELKVENFDTVDLFLEVCEKESEKYEQQLDKITKEHFNITDEELTKLYIEGYHTVNE